MSIRQMYPGGIVKPGFNPLAAQTETYTYYLYSWGQNQYGQLGLGNTTYYSSPKQVGVLTDWLDIAAGYYQTKAIKTDGTIWTMGAGGAGASGRGTTANNSSPLQIGSLTNWLQVSCGYKHAISVKTDGTIWAWGDNSGGCLGLGDLVNRSSPVQIGSLTNWASVSTATTHTLAIKTDGTLWAWGDNVYTGQLGTGNTTSRSSPVQVGSLTNWSKVSASKYASFAIKTDGTMWSWGVDGAGELGIGTDGIPKSSPVQIGALTNWLYVSGAYNFALAVKTDGTMWSWGAGNQGQLGLGNITNYSSPKQIGALTTWARAFAGSSGSTVNSSGYGIKTDGTLWVWGKNSTAGQLGLGNLTNYSSPKQVGSETTWYRIATPSSSSGKNILALKY